MKKEVLIKVGESFQTFDEMYDRLKDGDYSVVSRKCGLNDFITPA